jgi:hypothetical protein
MLAKSHSNRALIMYHVHALFAGRQCNNLDVALVAFELAGWDALLEHLFEFEVATALHLGEAEVQVDAHEDRGSEEDEGDFGSEVGARGVDQQWHHLDDKRGGQHCEHQVDGVGLLTHAGSGSFASDCVSYCSEGELILRSLSEEISWTAITGGIPGNPR